MIIYGLMIPITTSLLYHDPTSKVPRSSSSSDGTRESPADQFDTWKRNALTHHLLKRMRNLIMHIIFAGFVERIVWMNSRGRESMENLSALMTLLFVCIGAFRV